ncbi:HAD family phosphatase [Roseibacterium sp. SDUM158016]|uniref:HAD family hydrolase n=1 Tax=Roseicyclus sediminis TaxID=2980997 RepID=UPI0021CFFA07|nr:HAD family phosphatase [Roseibacterium sp. SDUM158016]MCU4652358.1 HAD family phosphatase [Roseibacterium sp. SDUM158016]
MTAPAANRAGTSVDAVIFDIGNVLIEWQPERYYDRTIGEDRRRAMFAEVDLHGMNDRVDLGHGFRDVIYETAETYPHWRAEIRDWHDNWIQLAQPVIPHSVKLLRTLRAKGVPVFALTNFGIESFAYARTQFDFLNEFDREFVSGHMGVIKPDPRIYEMVEEECGVPPGRLLFADDREKNVDAARARGWQAHLFEAPEGWAAALVAAGLLTPEEAAP